MNTVHNTVYRTKSLMICSRRKWRHFSPLYRAPVSKKMCSYPLGSQMNWVYHLEHRSLTHNFKCTFPWFLSKVKPTKSNICGCWATHTHVEKFCSGHFRLPKWHFGTIWVYLQEHPSLTIISSALSVLFPTNPNPLKLASSVIPKIFTCRAAHVCQKNKL